MYFKQFNRHNLAKNNIHSLSMVLNLNRVDKNMWLRGEIPQISLIMEKTNGYFASTIK